MAVHRFIASVAAAIAVLGLTGCGGESAPADEAAGTQSADYALARVGTLGIREAFFTVTGRSDGKTTAVVDFYVPRVDGAEDDLYPVAIRQGGCDAPGAARHDLGRLSASVTVVVLDAPQAEVAEELDTGAASVVIMAPDGKSIAWCGPLPA